VPRTHPIIQPWPFVFIDPGNLRNLREMPPHRAGAKILRIVPALLTGRHSFNCHAFGAFFVFRLNSELGLELGLEFGFAWPACKWCVKLNTDPNNFDKHKMQNLLHKYRISQPPYRHPEIVN